MTPPTRNRTAITDLVVSPYRFSDRPGEMIDFLELLGLTVVIRRDDFAVLQGKSGRVAVHPLAGADSVTEPITSLVLEVPDAVAAAEQLTAAGLAASWWDEAWGQQAQIAGPTGLISVNSAMEDFYGYQVSNAAPSPIEVVAVVFTPDLDAMTDFFAPLGFAPGADQPPGWRPLRAENGRGVIGVHLADRPGLDQNGYTTAALGFETTESLPQLAERMRAAGHPVEVVRDNAGGVERIDVTDPDGELVEIQPAAQDERRGKDVPAPEWAD